MGGTDNVQAIIVSWYLLALFGTMLIPFLPHNEFTALTYLLGIGASFIFIFAWLIVSAGPL